MIKYMKTMQSGQRVDIDMLLTNKKEAETKTFSKYYLLTFSDSSDTITFPEWNYKVGEKIEVGTVYKVQGISSVYNEELQLKADSYQEIKGADKFDYMEKFDTAFAESYLGEVISLLPDDYGKLARKLTGYQQDTELWNRFTKSPAAVKHHHNKIGGLIIHTAGVVKTASLIVQSYTTGMLASLAGEIRLDKNRVILKAILHDVAKMVEYDYEDGIVRVEGAIDHRVIVVGLIMNACKELDILKDEVNDICQSILSHHGEYGEFKMRTLEDYVLHLCDMIDSRVFSDFK